jgi:hypothetical protein
MDMDMKNQSDPISLLRWRLILGAAADPDGAVPLDANTRGMDIVLEQLYDPNMRKGGLGASAPRVNKWLGDIRKYFPAPVVQVMQRDALERLQLTRMLLEPELIEGLEPDVYLVGTLLTLKDALPDSTRSTARLVVAKVVEDIQKKLRFPVVQAVKRAQRSHRRTNKPNAQDIDWARTVYRNLRHYQPDLKTIIPDRIYGYARMGKAMQRIIFLADQSGSMSESVVFAGILGCVLASVPAVDTRFVAFDTAVVDLSAHLANPLDLLFGIQLGGGTDINKALAYAQQLIERPRETVLFLLSDLFEGGNPEGMLQKIYSLKHQGVRIVVLLALNDDGAPAFDRSVASALANMGIKAFACSPDQFANVLESNLNAR